MVFCQSVEEGSTYAYLKMTAINSTEFWLTLGAYAPARVIFQHA